MRDAMHCRECFARYGVEEPFITVRAAPLGRSKVLGGDRSA